MSKLEELIQQYCPSGVEYVRIGDIAQVGTGSSNGNEAEEEGEYPFFVRSQTIKRKNDFEFDEEAIIIPGEGGIGDIFHYINGKYALHQRVYRIHFTTDEVNVKFVYYYMRAHFKQFIMMKAVSATVVSIRKPMIEDFSIPVPPLPVQEEIVRILDNFSQLSAELEAELEGRRKQYDFYRNQLLSFDSSSTPVVWKRLGEVCTKVCSGGTPTSSNKAYYQGNIPWLRTQEVDWTDITDTELKITEEAVANSSAKLIPANCVIVAMYGATAAKAAINKIPITTNQACCNLEIDSNQALYKYVFHWLGKEYQNLKSLGQGSQSNLSAQTVKNYPIPIPSLAEQKRIVDILDRFDALCNDLTQGLPAEIEARKKQYEHYRDKLLTFKRK